MSVREGLSFGTDILSDAAPLNHLVGAVLDAAPDVRCFRDPTRGGLASCLSELAGASGVSMTVDEDSVPVREQVRGACEMLGYDVYQVANEGKMVAVVPPEQADAALAAMRASRYGEEAAIIGQVTEGPAGRVYVQTSFGARRIMDMLVGEQLPRIC
jgi:hydrogenase expression/formation protein HypE